MKKDWVLVTGVAEGGLGHEFARTFLSRGQDLVAVDRDGKILGRAVEILRRDFPGAKIFPLVADLSQADQVRSVWINLRAQGITVQTLVNNAGFAVGGCFTTQVLSELESMVALNVASVISMSHFFLNQRDPARRAYLLNVASTGALQPVPFLSAYAATKAAVLSFSRGIADELRRNREPVTVLALCPGPMKTHFIARAGLKSSFYFKDRVLMSPARVSEVAVRALYRGSEFYVPGFLNRLLTWSKFLPENWVMRIVGRLIQS